MQTTVALRRWTDFDGVQGVLRNCLADIGGIDQYVRAGQTVVIKPNLVSNRPASTGCTTHVELVEALVRFVQTCSPGRIIVAEGTGVFGTQLDTAFPTGGWREMAARTGVELYNLDGGPHAEVRRDAPRYLHDLPFSELVLRADVFITVPVLKAHIDTDHTVALKNSLCLTPQWKRSEIHRQELLEEALVDLNRIRKPDLSVVDGWDGMEGVAGGTPYGRPAGARCMLAGADSVSVDVVARELMCIESETLYLSWSIEDGLGNGDRQNIRVVGDSVEGCRRHFASPADELMEMLPGMRVCDLAACSGCRKAVLGALYRFLEQKILEPCTIVCGKEGAVGHIEGKSWPLGTVPGAMLTRTRG